MQIGAGSLRNNEPPECIRLHTQTSRTTDGGKAPKIIGSRSAPKSTAAAAANESAAGAAATANIAKFADQTDHTATAAPTANKKRVRQ